MSISSTEIMRTREIATGWSVLGGDLRSGRKQDVGDAAGVDPVGPDIDRWGFDPEQGQRRADLAAMIRPVVQRLREPAPTGASLW